MSRLVIHAILALVLCILFAAEPQARYKSRGMSVKKSVMSNITMVTYLGIQRFLPFELIENETEWARIDGQETQPEEEEEEQA